MADIPLIPENRITVDEVTDKKSSKDARKDKGTLFSFPYATPYQIQIDFMRNLFTAIEDKKLGIFESPTGTGKSLSLLCGALTWLELRGTRRLEELRQFIAGFDESKEEEASRNSENWIQAQLVFRKRKDLVYKAKRELKFREEFAEKQNKIKQIRAAAEIKAFSMNPKRKGQDKPSEANAYPLDDLWINDEFAPEFMNSDDEDEETDENEPEFYPFRIIFASRTHSQLSQFSNELKKTEFADRVSTVTLGSRQNMCINSKVTKLKNLSLINERCLDLQKKSSGIKSSEGKRQKCTGCQFYNHTGIEKLKNQILSQVLDIEDLVTAGKSCKACPYYATRKAAKEAQLILLPYNTVLHAGTRTGVGLSINSSSVLLLDEAHNIIESISNMYSTQITHAQLQDCHNGLKLYTKKYLSRFNPQNLLHYKQLTFIVKNLVGYLDTESDQEQRVMGVREFKDRAGIEELDFYELIKFTAKSRIIFKLKGFLQSQEKAAEPVGTGKPQPQRSNQSIICFIEFLKSIVFVGSQGKIIQDGKLLKFLLLNTSEHFSPLVNSARSIILAGGTMKPYEDIEDQLFHSAKDRIAHFSCDHVIPDENLKCIALSHGPSSVIKFDFTFKNRNSKQLLDELGRTLTNMSRIVPGGLVVFFPSYDYESMFHAHLVESGVAVTIEAKKKIFREPKDSSCEKILDEYGRQVRNNENGALLFAVVGGKLSEGINFGDDLGRCVIVVGLPYPNIKSVDVKEKLNFISETFGPDKANQFLPNACFKAVNQSIGRSIRHSGDYATIILLDYRFLTKDSQNQLPNWILSKYVACTNFGQCIGTLRKFFATKKRKQ